VNCCCLLAEQPGVYDFIVINDDLDKAYESLKSYLEKVGSVDLYVDVLDAMAITTSSLCEPRSLKLLVCSSIFCIVSFCGCSLINM